MLASIPSPPPQSLPDISGPTSLSSLLLVPNSGTICVPHVAMTAESPSFRRGIMTLSQ